MITITITEEEALIIFRALEHRALRCPNNDECKECERISRLAHRIKEGSRMTKPLIGGAMMLVLFWLATAVVFCL